MEQIEEFGLPPNPAKETDSRFTAYLHDYGEECWELDALEPKVITGLIADTVTSLRNNKKWDTACKRENEEKEQLTNLQNILSKNRTMSMDCKTCLENGGPPLIARNTGKCNYCDMMCLHAHRPEVNDRASRRRVHKALKKFHKKLKDV